MMRRPSRPLVVLLLWLAGFLSGCVQVPQQPQPPDPSLELLPQVQVLMWQGKTEAALELLDGHAWNLSGSVALERRRQDLRLSRGQRAQVWAELHQWAAAQEGADVELAYLQARLLEDPVERFLQLQQLHRQAPLSDWARLGLAATAQTLSRWSLSGQLLRGFQPQAAAAAFHRRVLARQWQQQGRGEAALALLEEDAFRRHSEAALFEYRSLASQAGLEGPARLASAELQLCRSLREGLSSAEAIDRAFRRLSADWDRLHELPLGEILAEFDLWLEIAGAPSGWSHASRYRMTPFAQLVRPESYSSPVAQEWADAGRALLAGFAPGRGCELHLLREVEHAHIPWRGAAQPLEVMLVGSVESTSGRTASGGTLFRGFYLRQDDLRRAVRRLELEWMAMDGRWPQVDVEALVSTSLPPFESLQLPWRLRRLSLEEGASIAQLERWSLVLHEAGHLPDLLAWIEGGPPWGFLFKQLFSSAASEGNPLLLLEYRAQLRALASGLQPRWTLAETLERARDPRDAYFRPYRKLLKELLMEAERRGYPPLYAWDRLAPESLTALAEAILQREGLESFQTQEWRAVVDSLAVAFDIFEQLPRDRPTGD